MKKLFLVLLLVIVGMAYAVPLILIGFIAHLCQWINIHEDLTSTKFVVWFIAPINYLEQKIKR